MDIKEWKEELCLSTVSRISGFTPDYIGYAPSKRVEPNLLLIKGIMEILKDSDNQKFSKRIVDAVRESAANDRVVWSGGYDTNSGHLKSFFRDADPKVTKLSEQQIFKIINKNPWFKTPELDFSDLNEIDNLVNYNPQSHPGHYTSKVFKSDKKGYTIKYATLQAKEMVKLVRKYAYKNYSLWDVIFREKDIKIHSEKEPSTRVVWNPEHFFTVINSWVFQKWMKGICISQERDDVRYLIDKEYDGYKGFKLLHNIQKYDLMIDPDWTLFDSTQTNNYLRAAIIIMFGNSVKNKEDLRFFYYIMKGITEKYVAVPPGIVIKSTKGLPSGHPGVTAVNCVVNLIRWSIIGFEVYGENYWEKMDLSVYGDDGFIGFTYHPNLFKMDEICEKYGFLGDSIIDKLFISDLFFVDPDCAPDFLKRRIKPGGIAWNLTKLFDKLIYPTKTRNDEETILVLKNYIDTGPGDDDLNDTLSFLIKYMLRNTSKSYYRGEWDYFWDVNGLINIPRKDEFIITPFKNENKLYNEIIGIGEVNICITKREHDFIKKIREDNVNLNLLTTSFYMMQNKAFLEKYYNNGDFKIPFSDMTKLEVISEINYVQLFEQMVEVSNSS